jgi:hypothetical protein
MVAKIIRKKAKDQDYLQTKVNFDNDKSFASLRQANLDAIKALQREAEDYGLFKRICWKLWMRNR